MIRYKEILKNVSLVVVSILVSILILDCLLHLTQFRSLLKREFYPRNYFVADNELGYVISKNVSTTTHHFVDGSFLIWSNSLGCFDREYNNEKDYIYLTGDSFTWGFSPFEDKWGTIIENSLDKRVMKCGVGGYGTKQEMLKTKRDLKLLPNPKLIIVGYLSGNDIEDDYNFPNYSVYKGYMVNNLGRENKNDEENLKIYENLFKYCSKDPKSYFIQGIKCWLNNNSIVYNLVKENMRKIVKVILPESLSVRFGFIVNNEPSKYKENVEVLSQNLINLLSFLQLAKEHGSDLLIVLIPGNNERQKEFLDQMNIKYIDLDLELSKYVKDYKKDLYWNKDGHWNVKGNHLSGYIVSKYLLENKIIGKDESELLKELDQKIEEEFHFEK